jgi:uncharacterized protein (DUF934 family)
MRRILKQRELIPDPWRYLSELTAAELSAIDSPGAAGNVAALIVPVRELLAGAGGRWSRFKGLLGVTLAPADGVEDLGAHIGRLSLVAVEFPAFGEGRGYTQARLLRTRLHFTGEVRATGPAVKQDLLFIMARSGFDAFELAPAENVDAARAALERYSVAYQPGEPVPAIRQQRFHAA